ncbi:hypothetical protein JL721_971 [Aureococcus anophagefferens]|nr:hypothetical protein JL721_971 [Aureococcus anophagefferens]
MGLGDVVAAFVEACDIDESLYYACGQDRSPRSSKLDDDIRLDLADMLLFCTAPCNLNDRFAVSMLNAACAAPAAALRANKQRCIALIAATLESRTLELPAKGADDAEKTTRAKKKGPAKRADNAKRRRPRRAKPKR